MFLQNLFVKRQPRKFAFTPFYYSEPDDEDESGPRIRFKRIRNGAPVSKKSMHRLVFLAIFFVFLLFFLWEAVQREMQIFEIESIKIEHAPTDY